MNEYKVKIIERKNKYGYEMIYMVHVNNMIFKSNAPYTEWPPMIKIELLKYFNSLEEMITYQVKQYNPDIQLEFVRYI